MFLTISALDVSLVYGDLLRLEIEERKKELKDRKRLPECYSILPLYQNRLPTIIKTSQDLLLC